MALAPIFDAACAYGTESEVGGKPVTAQERQIPGQLFGTICNTIIKQLGEERGDPETMESLADALSEVTGSAFLSLVNGEPGRHVAKLKAAESRQMVNSLTQLVGECLERRSELFQGMAAATDEDEVAEYEEALEGESDLLTPLVDSIGYTLKSGGQSFVPVFDSIIAPTFGKMLSGASVDVKARFASVCLFDDCVEHLGRDCAVRHAPALLQGVMEGLDDGKNMGDIELKQACVYGVAQIARQAPHALTEVVGPILEKLMSIVGAGAPDEDGVSLVENAVSALASMVVFKGAPFSATLSAANAAAVKETVLNSFPLREDSTEAFFCHEKLADLIEMEDESCVGSAQNLSRILRIIAQVMQSASEGEPLANPATLSKFKCLMGKLEKSKYAQNAFGFLEPGHQLELQKMVQQKQHPVMATNPRVITP